VADQLAPQRPSDRADRRSGRQQLAEPVLLVARRGQVGGVTDPSPLLDRAGIENAFRLLGDRLARRGVVADL
jgi:hypothetical protein